jgi:hypothetical protein
MKPRHIETTAHDATETWCCLHYVDFISYSNVIYESVSHRKGGYVEFIVVS